jgi:hypothetical protein
MVAVSAVGAVFVLVLSSAVSVFDASTIQYLYSFFLARHTTIISEESAVLDLIE